MTQLQHFYRAQQKIAECNNTFLVLLPTLTRKDLEKLIEKRPSLWARFAGYLPKLP